MAQNFSGLNRLYNKYPRSINANTAPSMYPEEGLESNPDEINTLINKAMAAGFISFGLRRYKNNPAFISVL
jgi:hypothetical protein